jgi:hypothetical protein
MAFTIVPLTNFGAGFAGGFSSPDLVSLGLIDDGGGGTLNINGLGVVDPTVGFAHDLKTEFINAGLLFNAYPLLRAFRALAPVASDVTAGAQFARWLDIKFNIVSLGPQGAGLPIVNVKAGLSGGPANVPYLQLIRAADESAVEGTWRLDLRLRHSTAE